MRRGDLYREMKRDLRRLSLCYPDLLRVFRLSETADGRWIYGIELGNPKAAKRIVVQASMHAREWLNTELVMKMAGGCCRKWKRNASYRGISYRTLLNNVCFFILPMVNPDGVAISMQGAAAIQKEALRNRILECGGRYRFWKANARGVDLNRNYNTGFGNEVSFEPGPEEYPGRRPFSERETRAIIKLIHKARPCAVINYHSAGHLIYYKEDSPLAEQLKKLTGYRLCREEGEPNGNLGDWLSKRGIAWCTLETGLGKAPVGHWQLTAEWKRHRKILAAVAALYQDS